MKLSKLLPVLSPLVLLTGCTFGASIDALMTPPKLSVEQEQIYNALTDAAGTSISLKYPKSGKYLSAFIVEDIDGDGVHEIYFHGVIYNLKGKALATAPVSGAVLAHVRDDLPGEQVIGCSGSKIVILADPNAKWSEAGKKRYAHPYYNSCLHNAAVGYNWAYDLAGL